MFIFCFKTWTILIVGRVWNNFLHLSCEVHQKLKYCIFKCPLQKFHPIFLIFVRFTFADLLFIVGLHFLQWIFGNIFLHTIFDDIDQLFMELNKNPKAIDWISF